MHILERSQFIPGELTDVFGFFEDPYNLQRITPPWLGFSIRSASDERVREGTTIEYVLRWHGLPMTWKSRISEYEQGVLFADEMLRGPYKRWYHRHLFRAVEGGVEVRDVVEYELPFGPLGRAVHAAVVRRQLEGIFDHRQSAIDRIFAAHPEAASPASL